MTPLSLAELMAEASKEPQEPPRPAEPRTPPTPMELEELPEFVRGEHRLHRFGDQDRLHPDFDDDEYVGEHRDPEGDAPLEQADVISSRLVPLEIDRPGEIWHRPLLDLDMGAALIPSSTEGRFHLYIDHLVDWPSYRKLLDALAECGIIEPGYAEASIERGYTALRLPWVKKDLPE